MTHPAPTIEHLIVCAHPSPDDFGHAVAAAYCDIARQYGHHATIRDLYGIGFDPVLRADERPGRPHWAPSPDVADELAYLERADMLVLIYPIWFGLPPAMLKGYVDRVMGANYSFEQLHDRAGQSVLKGKPFLSITTSGLPLPWLHEQRQVLSLREILDVYLWRGMGMKQSEHLMLDSIVPNMSVAHAEHALARVRETAEQTCSRLDGVPLELMRSEA